ncbi:hypothetical protein COZ14_04615, partial [Candidatus Dojkabacteria bacterium CG_4_10_14_3_um_filter_Dojkabacteria_WS6_41_9]
ITAEGFGYAVARGPGVSSWNGAGGSSHGGYTGGRGSTPTGDLYEPISIGSGGYGGGGYGSTAGAGGGAIKLVVTGATVLDGELNVNGATGICGGGRFGGAAGGSLYLISTTLSGTGLIKANGGERCSGIGSGGSGGRVAIYYTNGTFPLDANIQAYGAGTSGAGTIYIEQANNDTARAGLLVIDNNNQNAESAGVITGNYKFKEIKATRYGHVEFMGDTSTLEISSGVGLQGDTTKSRITVSGTLSYTGVGVLTIDGVDLGLNGKAVGIEDITIGATLNSGVTLYAHTWYHSNINGYNFGNLVVSNQGTLTLVSYDNGDADWTNDYGVAMTLANLNVAATGKITAEGFGYAVARGPGVSSWNGA